MFVSIFLLDYKNIIDVNKFLLKKEGKLFCMNSLLITVSGLK